MFKPDGTPLDPDRLEIGPTDVAFAEWEALGITPPNVERMRKVRLDRTVAELLRPGLVVGERSVRPAAVVVFRSGQSSGDSVRQRNS